MKGVVFNVLERIITEDYGEEAWEQLLDEGALDGAYTSLGQYEDSEFLRLVDGICRMRQEAPSPCLTWIGRRMLPHFEGIHPEVFTRYTDTLTLLRALNDVIHPEVVKLYPGAQVPVFSTHHAEKGHLVMEYESPRQMCSFAHGLMLGTGDRFGDELRVEHPECRHSGDERCLFDVRVVTADE